MAAKNAPLMVVLQRKRGVGRLTVAIGESRHRADTVNPSLMTTHSEHSPRYRFDGRRPACSRRHSKDNEIHRDVDRSSA